jgi:hypothetical protein
MAVDTAKYYAANQGKEREYVQVYNAVTCKEGETWVANNGLFNVQQSADEDGYKLKAYSGPRKCEETFIAADEFKAKYEDAGKLFLSVPPEDISAEDLAALTPIKKGKQMVVNVGVSLSTSAECDGFLYKAPEGNIFFSNYGLTTAFNYAGSKCSTHEDLVVKEKSAAPFKGIILAEDVTFDFKSGPFEAKAGSFLRPNPDDEDGFTAYPPGFAQFGLRRTQSDEQLAALVDVRTDDPVKVSKPLKFKK